MSNFFGTLDFSLPTAILAEIEGLDYEEYYFYEKIKKHRDNLRKLAIYVASYKGFTNKSFPEGKDKEEEGEDEGEGGKQRRR